MRHLTDLVARLTGGDLRIEVPHTERGDEVGAIARAIEDFRHASQEVQKREWLKRHLAAPSNELSQQHDYASFASAILAYLCPLAGAGHALMCRVHDESFEESGGYGSKVRRPPYRTTPDRRAPN